jgi:hypothetical protein
MLFQKGNNLKQNIEKDITVSQNILSKDTLILDNISQISNTTVINHNLFQDGNQSKEEKKKNLFQQAINFLTFDTPTYRSVFDEGQRRLMIVVSIIAPILISYIWFYDFEDEYLPSDWPVASPIFYLIFHVICLVYIWIREGSGNVRAGGNAVKSLWNIVKVGLISFLIVAAVAISFQEYEKLQEQKRIEQEKVVILEKTERFVNCIFNENIGCMADYIEQNKINEVLNGMTETFRDYDFSNGRLINIHVDRINSYPFYYEARGRIEYNIKLAKKKKFNHKLKNILVKYNLNLEIIEYNIHE